MHRTLRRLALVSVAVLCVSGLASAAGAADNTTTIHGVVLSPDGTPLNGVLVYDHENKKAVYVASSDENGVFSTRHPIAAGEHHLSFYDDAREYATVNEDLTLASGDNDLGSIALQQGATVNGLVTSPTGKGLGNVGVVIARNNTDANDEDYALAYTSRFGRFTGTDPISPGTYEVYVSIDGYHAARKKLVITDAERGTVVNAPQVTQVKVPPVVQFAAKSLSKHKLTVLATFDASYYSLGDSVGTARIYIGSKIYKTFSVGYPDEFPVSSKRITISGVPKGKHSVRVRFLGGRNTLPAWSAAHTVKVK